MLYDLLATEYVPLVGDLFVSGFLAGAASVRCSQWSLHYLQTYEPCAPSFQQQPLLLICSTPLHFRRPGLTHFDLAWETILQRHSITSKT